MMPFNDALHAPLAFNALNPVQEAPFEAIGMPLVNPLGFLCLLSSLVLEKLRTVLL